MYEAQNKLVINTTTELWLHFVPA